MNSILWFLFACESMSAQTSNEVSTSSPLVEEGIGPMQLIVGSAQNGEYEPCG